MGTYCVLELIGVITNRYTSANNEKLVKKIRLFFNETFRRVTYLTIPYVNSSLKGFMCISNTSRKQLQLITKICLGLCKAPSHTSLN